MADAYPLERLMTETNASGEFFKRMFPFHPGEPKLSSPCAAPPSL